ncbi:MAG: hypothetical protein Ct9H300mP28_26150 [Pseudomonadota bacterium]|nr:MAG: hypothetical protein Ct9H300mP28_26150 [Pseudomonadota bacterium]
MCVSVDWSLLLDPMLKSKWHFKKKMPDNLGQFRWMYLKKLDLQNLFNKKIMKRYQRTKCKKSTGNTHTGTFKTEFLG